MPAAISLGVQRDGTGLALEFDQIVDKFRRHPEMSGDLAMAVPFINEREHPLTQLNWMRFAQLRPPISTSRKGNHSCAVLGILDLKARNTL